MTDNIKSLVERLRHFRYYAHHAQESTLEAVTDLIEQQAARIAELEAQLYEANDYADHYRDELEKVRSAAPVADSAMAKEPLHKFALIRDRNYEGEGLSLWTWNGENYSGADGDCLSPDADGTLDGYTVEWLTDHQLEQRIDVLSKNAARYDFLRQRAELRQYEMGYYWHIKTVDVPMGMPAMAATLANVVDAAIAASEPTKEPT